MNPLAFRDVDCGELHFCTLSNFTSYCVLCVRAAAAKQSCTSRRLFLSLLQTTTPSATALSFFASAQEKRRWCSVHTYTTTMNFYSSPLLTKQIRKLMDMTTLTVEVSDYTVVGKQPKSVSFLFSKIFWVIFT